MTDAQFEAAEMLNWDVSEDDDYTTFENHSPEGEDLIIEIENGKNLAEELRYEADTFDVNEHVELWVDGRGKNGVPGTIRELLEDAEAIKRMYEELAVAFEELEEST